MNIKHNFIVGECIACASNDLEYMPAFFMPFISHRAFKNPIFQITKEITGLRDISNGYGYQYCRSLFCKICGHLACDLRFNDEQMKNLYQEYRGNDYLQLREFYEPGYIERNNVFNHEYHYRNKVEDFLLQFIGTKPLAVLDWGGDTGINTPFKGKLKIHHIYDISNIEPIQGALLIDYEKIPRFNYDLVICQHVLEHLPFPAQSIINLIKNIKDKPFFYFEVPHEPTMRKTLPNNIPQKMHWHEHINFYSENSLVELLGRCGLKVININSANISRNNSEDNYVLQCIAKL